MLQVKALPSYLSPIVRTFANGKQVHTFSRILEDGSRATTTRVFNKEGKLIQERLKTISDHLNETSNVTTITKHERGRMFGEAFTDGTYSRESWFKDALGRIKKILRMDTTPTYASSYQTLEIREPLIASNSLKPTGCVDLSGNYKQTVLDIYSDGVAKTKKISEGIGVGRYATEVPANTSDMAHSLYKIPEDHLLPKSSLCG